jgi:hypothetical protein
MYGRPASSPHRLRPAEPPERRGLEPVRSQHLSRYCRRVREGRGNGQTTSPNPNPTEPNTTSLSTYATSIKLHVSITLNLTDNNYTNWRELFLVALGRYGLTAHVTGDATPSDTSPTSAWGRDDYTMLSWIYGSIDTDLLGIVMHPGSTARTIWDAIENLFHDNKKHRAIQLEADLRNMPQGNLSISDYCAKFKNLADSLTDVGQPITDEMLVNVFSFPQ